MQTRNRAGWAEASPMFQFSMQEEGRGAGRGAEQKLLASSKANLSNLDFSVVVFITLFCAVGLV